MSEERIKCAICHCDMTPNSPCPICGWDGKNEYILPFDDKDNFDQALFDSIQLPKKPASAKKVFLISSIPVLLFIPFAGPAALIFEPVAILLYFIFRSYEKDWEWKKNNFEKYRISQYNHLKPQKDEREVIQRKIHSYERSATKFVYAPFSFEPTIARYSVQSSKKCVEVVLNEKQTFDIPFGEIIGAEVLEDKEVRGSVGRAVVGGAIAGDVGAIIGASTTKKSVTTFIVRILTNNIQHPAYDIPLIKEKQEVGSKRYKDAIAFANDVQASIKSIVSSNQASKPIERAEKQPSPVGVAEEIKKFKELLDCGAITKEEYEAKKKQLLDL